MPCVIKGPGVADPVDADVVIEGESFFGVLQRRCGKALWEECILLLCQSIVVNTDMLGAMNLQAFPAAAVRSGSLNNAD